MCHLILNTIKQMTDLQYFYNALTKNSELKFVLIELELLISCKSLLYTTHSLQSYNQIYFYLTK